MPLEVAEQLQECWEKQRNKSLYKSADEFVDFVKQVRQAREQGSLTWRVLADIVPAPSACCCQSCSCVCDERVEFLVALLPLPRCCHETSAPCTNAWERHSSRGCTTCCLKGWT